MLTFRSSLTALFAAIQGSLLARVARNEWDWRLRLLHHHRAQYAALSRAAPAATKPPVGRIVLFRSWTKQSCWRTSASNSAQISTKMSSIRTDTDTWPRSGLIHFPSSAIAAAMCRWRKPSSWCKAKILSSFSMNFWETCMAARARLKFVRSLRSAIITAHACQPGHRSRGGDRGRHGDHRALSAAFPAFTSPTTRNSIDTAGFWSPMISNTSVNGSAASIPSRIFTVPSWCAST